MTYLTWSPRLGAAVVVLLVFGAGCVEPAEPGAEPGLEWDADAGAAPNPERSPSPSPSPMSVAPQIADTQTETSGLDAWCDEFPALTVGEEGHATWSLEFNSRRTTCRRTVEYTCWVERDLQPELGWVAYRTVTLAPGTSILIDAEVRLPFGTAMSIEASEGCAPGAGSNCEVYEAFPQARQSISRNYLSNASERSRTYLIRFAAQQIDGSAHEGVTPGELEIRVSRQDLDLRWDFCHGGGTGLSCDSPARLEPSCRIVSYSGLGVRTTTAPSYGYEYWEVEVPPMRQLRGGLPSRLFGCRDCGCTERHELVNDTNETVTMLARRELGRRHNCTGYWFEPLSVNAVCESAAELTGGGVSRVQPYRGGNSTSRCGLNISRPHYYRALVPAGQRLEVSLSASGASAPQRLALAMTEGCENTCLAGTESDFGAERHALSYENPGETDVEVVIAVGGEPQGSIDVEARLFDLLP